MLRESRSRVGRKKEVLTRANPTGLSERDGLLILELVGNPPAPTPKLLAAALALPTRK